MPSRSRSAGGRSANPADSDLWNRITADVTPLRRRDTVVGKADPPMAPPPAAESSATVVLPPGPRSAPASPSVRTEPELRHGVAPGLDKRTLAKLRRGQFPVEAEIDLHRCTQDEASVRLRTFLASSQAAGRRCVLIITGKGLRSDRPIGVLRHAVPHWLNLPDNRARVLAFCHATPADGGEGALYILLRRQK